MDYRHHTNEHRILLAYKNILLFMTNKNNNMPLFADFNYEDHFETHNGIGKKFLYIFATIICFQTNTLILIIKFEEIFNYR